MSSAISAGTVATPIDMHYAFSTKPLSSSRMHIFIFLVPNSRQSYRKFSMMRNWFASSLSVPSVVISAQIAGAYQAAIDSVGFDDSKFGESIFATLTSHNIPARAISIALVFGGINALLSISQSLWYSETLANLSVTPIAIAFMLPLVFGQFSQVISYRRTRFHNTDR